jgi:UDP:flavonoid glycosyltransferase YjiC (YdhE family)
MRLLIPLFSPATGTWGGLTRALALAEAALARGHAVAFCASGPMAAQVARRGHRVFATPAPGLFGLPAALARPLVRFSQHVSIPGPAGRPVGNIWLVLAATGFARAGYLRRLVAAELDAVRGFSADVLFTDLDPGAPLVARLTGLPLATNYAWIGTIGTGTFGWKLIRRAAATVLRAHGHVPLTPEELCFAPSVLKIIPSIPELEDTAPDRSDVRFVGPLLGLRASAAPEQFLPEPGRRYVFAYLGTGSLSIRALRAVLPRVFPADGAWRCVVAAQAFRRVERVAGVEFRPYVDAESILPCCDWTICHGGQNTIMQSLQHGVPLILFPGSVFERRYNAEKVQAAGAGVLRERAQFTPDALREALSGRPAAAASAVRLQAQIRTCGGAAAAVDAIEAWLPNAVRR